MEEDKVVYAFTRCTSAQQRFFSFKFVVTITINNFISKQEHVHL